MSTPTEIAKETPAAPAAQAQAPAAEAATSTESAETTAMTYREAITTAMVDELNADPNVLLMGEDVATEGGVFKTSPGLAEQFGHERIINTPICENGFLGVALGMSLMGLRPVVEIMFADFLPTGGDAIVNQLPKYRFMSGGQCSVPVTIRVISGGTGRFGTQHSATGESWFMGLPGMRVVTASTPGSAYELLRAAIRDQNPVIFHEHKGLYGRKGEVRRGAIAEVGRAAVLRQGADVTIVATLLMVERSLKAAEALAEEGIEAEVIDLRWVRPMDVATVRASVERTGRLVVAEEQVHHGGWGASLISELTTGGLQWKSPPIAVSLPYDLPIPYSPTLEDAIIPSPARIADAARTAVRG
jgi:acetoin:2,6-dichlorophenolindophenol oxidoreductase subunit beta